MNSRIATVTAFALVMLTGADYGRAQAVPDLQPVPPPEGACAEETIAHVLTEEEVGAWRRVSEVTVGEADEIESLTDADLELLGTYQAECAAVAEYADGDGAGRARVLVIAFNRRLHALGFFTAQREDGAKRVLLTSAAFRNEPGKLHAQSTHYYLRVEVTGVRPGALPPDQYLAARFEVRLPAPTERPRLLRVIPRGWVNELTVNYEPTTIFGEEMAPMALKVRQEIGRSKLLVQAIELEPEADVEQCYTLLLQGALEAGRAWEVRGLGEEAFAARDGALSMAMRQDEFLVHVSGDVSRKDAEATLRLIGTLIRTSRPLPELPAAELSSDAPSERD